MRILEVSNFMPPHAGGIEQMITTLMEGLQRSGHEVRWIASAAPSAPGISGSHVRVPAWNWLERNVHVPMPIWTPRAWGQLRELIRWADVVHAHDCLYLSSAGAVLLSRQLHKPVLITQHVGHVPYGGMLELVQALAYRGMGRALLSAADEVVTYSPHVAEYFAKLGVRKPFRLIPLGFESRFRPLSVEERRGARRSWDLPIDSPIVVFAARLVPKKGVHFVAEVQRRLAADGVTLLVAGEGPLQGLLEGLPRTRHLQQVPHDRMPEFYGLADILLLPSVGEGLPLTLQEGMLTGLPAVVSTDPSFVANVADAPGVSLVDGVDALVAAVRLTLARRPDREAIANWARERWGLERFIREYERTFAALIQLRSGTTS